MRRVIKAIRSPCGKVTGPRRVAKLLAKCVRVMGE